MSSTKTNTWISVDKKEPANFEEKMLFATNEKDWCAGWLVKVESTKDGKAMTITVKKESVADFFNGYKFWMKPEPPTK